MQLEALRQALHAAGASPAHAARVLRLWAHALPQTHGKRAVDNWQVKRPHKVAPPPTQVHQGTEGAH